MGQNLVTKISELIKPVIEVLGFELWGCEILAYGKHTVLRVYIDAPNGVGLDDCGRVSKQLNGLPDLEEVIVGNFDLEVSSPGLDRQLYSEQHYLKYIDREVQLKLHLAKNGQRNFVGRIKSVAGGKIYIDVNGAILELALFDIEKARLVPKIDFKT